MKQVLDESKTPRELGYRMPAEWSPHEATWIAWPHNQDDWPDRFGPIPWVFGDIVRHIHGRENVHIFIQPENTREATEILRRLGIDLTRIEFFPFPTDRVWTRDYAPIFVSNAKGSVAFTNWKFNAWAKYDNWQHDNAIPDRIATALSMRQWKPTCNGQEVVLEGGSIDVNGEGTLLTTEECLLSDVQARNPGLTKEDLESAFADYLGIDKVIWLNRGIAGDDTHGHVDDIARFVDPTTVVAAVEADPKDQNYEALQENLARLQMATDQDGRPLRIVLLPMPRPVYFDGQRLPASYANFYIANGVVLAPTFNDERDREALAILAGVFPSRRVVGIHCLDLVWGLGTIHCMTQQQPGRLSGRRRKAA